MEYMFVKFNLISFQIMDMLIIAIPPHQTFFRVRPMLPSIKESLRYFDVACTTLELKRWVTSLSFKCDYVPWLSWKPVHRNHVRLWLMSSWEQVWRLSVSWNHLDKKDILQKTLSLSFDFIQFFFLQYEEFFYLLYDLYKISSEHDTTDFILNFVFLL